MIITELFEIQKQRDEVRPEGQTADKVLALQIALGKLAENWQGYKYWQEYRKPRTDPDKVEGWPNPLRDVFVECLGWFLSIGNDLSYTGIHGGIIVKSDLILDNFNDMFVSYGDFVHSGEESDYRNTFAYLIFLSQALGFEWVEIDASYRKYQDI